MKHSVFLGSGYKICWPIRVSSRPDGLTNRYDAGATGFVIQGLPAQGRSGVGVGNRIWSNWPASLPLAAPAAAF
jgi:hypothetical protein